MINVQSVLVEHTHNGKVYANSGCLVNNEFVLITSNVFVPLLNDSKISLGDARAGLLNPSRFFEKTPKVTVVVKNEDSSKHQYKQAVIVAAYLSETIRTSAVKYLYDWTIDVDEKSIQLKEALSLFFIAKIDLIRSPDVNEVLGCFARLKRQSRQAKIKVGDKVCVESTPFGNRHFLKCHTRGIVANIIGENDCFILTDVPAAPGSEGSPVFAKLRDHEIPIGMVISCMSWWKGEWIGLTLSVSFDTFFDEILYNTIDKQNDNSPIVKSDDNPLFDALAKSTAQVTCGTFWGTAILLDRTTGTFITNSHVIENESPILHWNDVSIRSQILYKSVENQIFDIAILQAAQNDLEAAGMVSVKLSTDTVNIGDKVYAFGFPLFPRHMKAKPTLTTGHISQVSKSMLKTSCTVLPGASGGGIFKTNGSLVGLIVCNAKMEENSTTFPRVNMAVPIAAISDVLLHFLRDRDPNILKQLQMDGINVIKEWNFLKGKI